MIRICLGLLLAACGDDAATTPDTGGMRIDGGGTCSAALCSDGVFCNGEEVCNTSGGCIAATAPACLAGQVCSEVEDRCRTECEVSGDADGDGVDSPDCGGTDCDDSDARRYPGATEICDAVNLDEDCDLGTFGMRDADGDTHFDAQCCNIASDGTPGCGSDCDDARPGSNPDVPEVCDGLDNDCDDSIDEDVLVTFYRDLDGDDFGNPMTTIDACSAPAGYAVSSGDCDDMRGSVNPAALEICDTRDNDCDGMTDPGCACTIGMSRDCGEPDGMGGFVSVGQCEIGTQLCVDGEWGGCSGDVRPLAESCNGADDDCDGPVDEGVLRVCYTDADSDSWAPLGPPTMMLCGDCPAGLTTRVPIMSAFDCDDDEPTRHPVNIEICDRVDSNCSTPDPMGIEVSEDFDNDGFSPIGAACTGGLLRTDCYDMNAEARVGQTMFYGVHRGDGSFDYDCDGLESKGTGDVGRCDCAGGCEAAGSRAMGWVGSVPACGVSAPYIRGCRNTGMCPSMCEQTLAMSVQTCR